MTPRRRRPDDDTVEVVLEGQDDAHLPRVADADAGELAAAAAAGPASEKRRTGRRVRALASAVAAAVGVVAVVNVVTLRGEEERRAAFAAVADVVTDLGEPLEQVWEIEAPAGGTLAGDLALVPASSSSGAEIRAFDAATGEQRWAVDRGTARGVDWCDGGVGTPEEPVVVCWSVTVPDGEGDHGGRSSPSTRGTGRSSPAARSACPTSATARSAATSSSATGPARTSSSGGSTR